jgi:hypothetical protein
VIEKEVNNNIGPLGIRAPFFCQRDDSGRGIRGVCLMCRKMPFKYGPDLN